MQPAFVRVAYLTLAAAAVAACSDAGPGATRPPEFAEATASKFAVAKATVRVIPGLDGLSPAALNDSDEIVGNDTINGPWRWTQAKGLVRLPFAPHAYGIATSVSDNGGIGGSVGDTIGTTHGVVWLPNLAVHIFPLDDSSLVFIGFYTSCGIRSINVYGQMASTCEGRFPIGDTFNWHGPTVPTGPGGILNAISDDGWMGGQSASLGTQEGPILISPAGQVITLLDHNDQVDPLSDVHAVTLHGWAAGSSQEGTCTQAVAWLSNPGQTYPEFRLGVCGEAYGITDDWYVIGTGTTDGSFNQSTLFAFVWFPGPGTQTLPGLGTTGETSVAVGINKLHHVIGTITSGGVTHVVIWNVAQRT